MFIIYYFCTKEQRTSHLFGHWQTQQYVPPPVVDVRDLPSFILYQTLQLGSSTSK